MENPLLEKSVFLEITDNELVVANTGQPFDTKGVISICSSHLSSKDVKIEDVDKVERNEEVDNNRNNQAF